MRILSIKRGFETDHSSTHTEYIMGFEVTCDYDWWTCEFELPDKRGLFEKIKEYEAFGDYELAIEKKESSIIIAICVHIDYSRIAPKDPYIAFANACNEIKKNILNGDFSDLELLKAYVVDEKKFHRLESASGIKKILEKNL